MFALAVARAARRQVFVNPLVQAIPVLLMGLLFAAGAVDAGADDPLFAAVAGAAAAVVVPLALWMPFMYGHLDQGVSANRRLLAADDLERLAALAVPEPPTSRSRLGDLVGVAFSMAVIRLLVFRDGLAESAFFGVLFALLFVGLPWGWQAVRRK